MAGHGDGDSTLKAVVVAVAVNFVITIAKYVGWVFTWSPALLAEAIHSTADVGNQVLLWIGLRQSERDADEDHPYGWGQARYLWNLKSAMGIFFLGCGVTLYHGVHEFYESLRPAAEHAGEAAHGSGLVGIVILVVSFLLEGYSFYVAFQGIAENKGEQSWADYIRSGDDPTAVGILLEDSAAVLGVLLALLGLGLSELTGSPYPDIAATLLIGALLGWIAIFLAKANGRLLIGASAPTDVTERIRAALEADELVEKVDDLKTEVLGQGRIRVKCEVDLYEKLVALRMRDQLDDDARRIRDGQPAVKVLVDVVGRSVRITGKEIQRLEGLIHQVAPEAVHIDLELI